MSAHWCFTLLLLQSALFSMTLSQSCTNNRGEVIQPGEGTLSDDCTSRYLCADFGEGPFRVAYISHHSCPTNTYCNYKGYCKPLDECTIEGEDHITTFDGSQFNLDLDCKSLLAESNSNEIPEFEISTKKTPSMNDTNILIEIKVYGYVIQMYQQFNYHITDSDGLGVNLDSDNRVNISMTDHIYDPENRLSIDFGLFVTMNYDSKAHISLKPNITGMTKGICGDNDGNPDNDLTGRDGVSMTGDLSGFENSWQVADPKDSTCKKTIPCEESGSCDPPDLLQMLDKLDAV
ncbi:hypothetical protein CAPTEDRAFT_189420 [Capitella teleta]|uniref:VWFD domain-containing protein n=1 Tax=Capitella teleta TaxID=283909 RepID=R7VGX2_CAPTE|nr:hypothetical protein CAPTEDRAFT_189420 [Capitella teleta]|eukprot:ELU15556.1 hypothetical protein CAPTEDRAFT_189420 [Capitella teleta]